MGPYSLLMLSISLLILFHMPCLPVVVSENLRGFISFLLILLTVPCLCILCLTCELLLSLELHLWEVFEDRVTEKRLFASAYPKEGTANSQLL